MALLGQASTPQCKISLSVMPRYPLSEEAYLDAIREQIQLGVTATYPNIKWSDLEGGQGLKPLQDQIGVSKFIGGDAVFCLKPIDTSNKSVPASLQTLPFDDPKVQEAWEEAVLEVAKALPKSVKVIALGNEVDVYFDEHPKELPAYLNMVKSAKTLLRGAGIKTPVGVITTFDGLVRRPELVKQIHSNFDVVMMTYYPMNSAFEVLPMASVPSHFERMLGMAGTKPLVLTELGCPAGTLNKSSEDIQADFIAQCFKQLKQNQSRISFANFFIQSDFGDPVVDMLETYYRLKDDRFRSYLATLGLSKSDGTRRKAFGEFKRQMRAWNSD
jgi:hypothetical protein